MPEIEPLQGKRKPPRTVTRRVTPTSPHPTSEGMVVADNMQANLDDDYSCD